MEPDEDDDVDHSLAHISTRPQDKQIESSTRKSKKGVIEWDESLDEMKREKESAEAVWGKLFCLFSSYQLLISDLFIQRLENAIQVSEIDPTDFSCPTAFKVEIKILSHKRRRV
jgi:hypothetical protein